MSQKYALYKLVKVVGKKEYIPHQISSKGVSYKEAQRQLESEYEDLPDGALWFNPKIHEYVTYELGYRMMYVPNYTIDEYGDGKLLGVYRRYPIFFIGEYPNPYSSYRVHVSRTYGLMLEGIK